MPPDASYELWTELRKGNADALAGLYREHYLGLMNYGMKLTGDHELTRDSITQLLLNLHRQHARLPPVNNVRSYLLTSLRNEILSVIRSGRLKKKYDESRLLESHVENSYEEHLMGLQEEREQKERLAKALEHLSSREKELLQMRYFDDKSYEQIATECNITKRTAYNIINNALKRLKTFLTHQSRNKFVYLTLVKLLSGDFL